jgi:tRNA-specific 2-thiouridylase
MKIAVLVSGGVDSSVALRLLKDQGHDLTAFYLKIWLEDELSFLGDCPWEEDLKYVQAVCKLADVPLEVVNLQEEYHNKVVSYAISEVKAGRTPSPDLFCNKLIKFGCFLEKFGDQFDKVATGHYAQLDYQNNKFLLKKVVDPIKDQTYFLSHLDQNQLSKILFPIGNLQKSQVRELAQRYDLPNKDRKDSQGICFLGKIKFSDFIKHHLGVKKGDLIEFETGKKVGEHEGFWYYTLGQRKGIGLSGGPWFVVQKDPQKNVVFISNKYFTPEKKRDILMVSSFNWISGKRPEKKNLHVKIRHGEQMYGCTLDFTNDGSAVVKLDGQDQGLAPGQFAVFYDGDFCLGCGVID